MAKDIITRFKLETTAYDSKLRDASKGLADYAKTATAAGKEFGKFTQANVEAARALGNIAPSANNAKDKVKELVTAYNDLAKAYNALTKEQQSSDFGKAMADSLGKLKTQIADAKQELYGMGDAMKKAGEGSSGLTSMLAVFGGNLLTKGVSMLTSELVGSVQQSIELAQQGEGIRNAFERLNKPGLLDNLKEATHGTVSELELMKAAVKFDDFKLPVEQLGTLLAFAQKKAKDTGQSVDYMVDSIVTGLGRKSLMILDNLGLSAAQIKERMAESGDMTKAVADIIKEQMAEAGEYVETAADRAARATAKAQDAAEAFGRNAIPIAQEWAETWATLSQGAMSFANTLLGPVAKSIRSIQNILNSGPDVDDYKNTLIEKAIAKAEQEKRKSANVGYQGMGDKQKVKAPGGYVEVTDSHTGAVIGGRHFNNLEDKNSIKDWQKGLNKSTRTSGSRSNTKKEQTELQQNQKRINDLTQKYVDLMSEASRESKPLTNEQRDRAASIKKEIRDLERRNGQLKLYQEQTKGKFLGSGAFKQQLEVDVAVNNKKIEEMERQLINLDGITIDTKNVKVTAETDEARQKVEELKRQIAELKNQNIQITAAISSIGMPLSETPIIGVTDVSNGKGKNQLVPAPLMPTMDEVVRQRGGNLLDDKAMKAINDGIYGDTGKEKGNESALSYAKKQLAVADTMAGNLGNILSGLTKMGIELPEGLSAIVEGTQSIISIVTSIMTLVSIISTLTAVKSTPIVGWLLANGGIAGGARGRHPIHAATGTIVPGNNYSGDRVPALVNSGELILNRAQQGNIASQLQGGGMQNMNLQAIVTGEQLRFILNTNSRRRGKGEYVTSTHQ